MSRLLAAFSDPGPLGLGLHVVAVWGALALSIGILARSGSGFGAEIAGGPRDAPWTPPGAFIGAVWSALYTLMAVALWLVNRESASISVSPRISVGALILFCLLWPFYAFDGPSRWPGLLGNLGILALALIAVVGLWPHHRVAALLIAPVAVWITVATATILDGGRRYGWSADAT